MQSTQKWRILTITTAGEHTDTKGQCCLSLQQTLVTKISEYILLGVGLLQNYNIKLYLENSFICIGDEELVVSAGHSNIGNYRIVETKD